jgi:hypothetical protein
MARCFRRSILNQIWSVLSFFCVLTPLALAQHAPGRVGGAGVHVSAPPIYRGPISQPPVYHAPVYHAPVYQPRYGAFPPARIPGGGSFRRWPVRRWPPLFFLYPFPFPSTAAGPFWGSGFCWWASCDLFWGSVFAYDTAPAYGPANYVTPQVYEEPVYVSVYGEERWDTPELYLKDGTILNVTDYWLVDGQLHFTMIEEENAKPAEHVIPFDELDLQKTVDVNTHRGFRFVLRDEPVDQYLRDHPDAEPPVVTAPVTPTPHQ